MYQLSSTPTPPTWLDLLPGVRLRLRPLGSAGFVAARFAAAALPETATGADRAHAYTVGAACWGAVEWEGVGDEAGAPLELNPDRLAALLSAEVSAFDAVDLGYVMPALSRDAEKNGLSPSPTGGSTAAKITVPPAGTSAPNAPQD